MMMCSCTEAWIDHHDGNPPQPTGRDAHDCEYVSWRNSLIPLAERTADTVFKRYQEAAKWSLFFHHEMNRLVKEKENQ